MTDALAKELEHKKGLDDGRFWISAPDFFKRYRAIDGVRMFDKEFKVVSTRSIIKPDNSTEHAVSFSLVPESQTKITIVLAQRDRRRKSKGEGDEYPIGIGFQVHQTDKPEAVYDADPKTEVVLDVKPKGERSVVGYVELDPGFGYYVVPYLEVSKEAKLKKTLEEFQIYIRVYSTTTTVLEELGYQENDSEASDNDEEGDDEGQDDDDGGDDGGGDDGGGDKGGGDKGGDDGGGDKGGDDGGGDDAAGDN